MSAKFPVGSIVRIVKCESENKSYRDQVGKRGIVLRQGRNYLGKLVIQIEVEGSNTYFGTWWIEENDLILVKDISNQYTSHFLNKEVEV